MYRVICRYKMTEDKTTYLEGVAKRRRMANGICLDDMGSQEVLWEGDARMATDIFFRLSRVRFLDHLCMERRLEHGNVSADEPVNQQ